MVKIWCEWDMGWNIDDNTGVYSTMDIAISILDSIDWTCVGYSNWKEVEEDGMLSIDEIEE